MLVEKIVIPKLTSSEIDKSYIAGIIDGEGYIGITERLKPPSRSQSPVLTGSLAVSMTDREAVMFIAERHRGRLYRFPARDSNHREYYNFSATSLELRELLEDIIPYLKVKYPQALIMMSFLDTISAEYSGGGPRVIVPDDVIRKRQFCNDEIKRLNRREV